MPAIVRPRNQDGTLGDPVKFGNGETDKEIILRLEAEKQALEVATFDLALVIDAQAQNQAVLENAVFELANIIAGGNV